MSEIFVKTLDFGGEDTYHPLPIVDIDDNDKVLMVVDGKWAVADNDCGSGQYVWTKYTSSGGSLIGYAVSDNPNKYPDGGTQGGCYYTLVNGPVKIVTWAGGTDVEIAAMVAAADRGEIKLSDYWSVGDERTVRLAAMDATGVGESHDEEDVTMVPMNAGGKALEAATASVRTECSFIVGLKNCLATAGYMDTSNTPSWNSSKRRTWCNETFSNALPNTLRGIFKRHYNISIASYQATTNKETADLFALPA